MRGQASYGSGILTRHSLHAITILHLSDLHERGPREQEAWRRRRVLGEAWLQSLDELQAEGPIDLVCFTGDLADWGLAQEYLPAGELLDAALSRLKVPRDRLFLVPGNHDINRKQAAAAWATLRHTLPQLDAQAVSRWLAGGPAPLGVDAALRDAVLSRQSAYRDWLRSFDRSELAGSGTSDPAKLGYRVTLQLDGRPFAIHLLGLDSAWLAGGDDDAGKLRLTADQVMRLATDAKGERLTGLRIVLVHHPLTDLADGASCRRLLADHVDVLLRGHQHEPEPELWADPDRRLLQLAAGCLYEGHKADEYPNGHQLLRIWADDAGRPQQYELRFRSFSTRGFWHDDSSLYKAARQGRLTLRADGSALTEPRYFQVPLEENPYFTGRAQTLAELRLAALAAAACRGHPAAGAERPGRRRQDPDCARLHLSLPHGLRGGVLAGCINGRGAALGLRRASQHAGASRQRARQVNRRQRPVVQKLAAAAPALAPRARQRRRASPGSSRCYHAAPQGTSYLPPAPRIYNPWASSARLKCSRLPTRRQWIFCSRAPSGAKRNPASASRRPSWPSSSASCRWPWNRRRPSSSPSACRLPTTCAATSSTGCDCWLMAQPQMGDYPLSVLTTWQVNFDQIQTNKTAVAALRLCALLGAAPIPFELLCEVAAAFDPRLGRALRSAATDPVQLEEVLRPLLRYSLLQREAGGRTVSMHRLVQEVVKDSLCKADQKEYARRLVDALSSAFPRPEESSNWPSCERWLPHVLSAIEHCRRFKLEGELAASLHNQTALYLDGRMQPTLAEPLFKHAIALRQRIEQSPEANTQNRVNLSVILCNLATLYLERGDMTAADAKLTEAEKLIQEREGAQSPYLCITLLKRAQLLRVSGRYVESDAVNGRAFELVQQSAETFLKYGAHVAMEQAENLLARGLPEEAEAAFTRALQVCELLHGKDSDLYATLRMHQSKLLRNRGQVRDAETLAREAFEQAKKNLGESHPRFADAAQTLALAVAERGRFQEALTLFELVSKLRLDQLGAAHYLYAECLRNEATCHRGLTNYAKAAALAERAVKICEEVDEHSSSFHEYLNELGLIYCAQGRHQDAERIFLRVLAMVDKTLGPSHSAAATAHNNLALVYEAKAEYQAAEREYRRAADICRLCVGEDHPDYLLKLHNLAHTSVYQGRHDEALKLYAQVLAGWKRMYGGEHDKVATCLYGMAAAALAAGDMAGAEQYAQESLGIAEKLFGPHHPGVARSLAGLAQCFQAQQLYKKAVPLYERALGILVDSGQEESLRGSVLSGLGACLWHLNRATEGVDFLRQALKLKERCLGPQHAELAATLSELGSGLLMQGSLAESETYLERARELIFKTHGEKHPRYATLLSNLGVLRRHQGRADEAIELEKSAAALREQLLGKFHPDVAHSYTTLADMQAAQGQHADAQQSLAQASRSADAQRLETPHQRFIQLMQQGKTEQRLGQYVQAAQTLQQCAQAAIVGFGADSAEHLRALVNISALWIISGQVLLIGTQLPTADKLVKQLPDLPTDLLCNYHLAKGAYLRFSGDLTGAAQELQTALGFASTQPGQEPMAAIQAHNGLAGIAEAHGDRVSANTHYQAALTKLTELPPSRERDDLEQLTLINHSQTLAVTQRFQEAEAAITRAEALVDRVYPKSHPLRIPLLRRRAVIAQRKKDWKAELQYLEQAAQLGDSIWSKYHPERGDLLHAQGEAYAKVGQFQKAIQALKQAITIHKQSAGATSRAVRQDLFELAQVQRRSGDATQAVQSAEKALAISRSAQPPVPAECRSRHAASRLRSSSSGKRSSSDCGHAENPRGLRAASPRSVTGVGR